MDFHQVIYPICPAFVLAPTLCVLVRISYFKSRDLSLSLMVIEDFLLQDLNSISTPVLLTSDSREICASSPSDQLRA